MIKSLKNLKRTAPRTALPVVLLLITICSNVCGEDKGNIYNDYLLHAEKESGFSGSVLIVKDTSILISKGYGLANRETLSSITADTKFLLCSVTKQFTAAAIMQMAERGLLSLNDPVTKYLTDYAGSSADNITIYNLLTQTSGVVDYLSLVTPQETFEESVPTDQVVKMFMEAPLEFEPGSKWQYSNSNYYLLGKIIELISGTSYGEYIEVNIFKPIGMNHSGFPARYLNDLPESATGYKSEKSGKIIAATAVHSSWPYSAGGLYSTAYDMAKWDRALRNETLLTTESLTKMFTPFRWRYGCGWEIDTLYGQTVVSHAGTGGGYCAIILRFTNDPLCIVVLSNNESNFKQVSKIAYELAAISFGRRPDEDVSEETIVVDQKVLDEYAGDYEVAPGMAISFIHRDGALFTHGPGQPEMEIYPRSKTEFFLKAVDGSVRFIRDSTGVVSGIIIRQGGRDMPASKIR